MNVKQEENVPSSENDKWNNPTSTIPSKDILDQDEWMIRSCEIYKDEHGDCTSVKSRFQQYFVFGKMEDCTPWRRDYNNCVKWIKNKDFKARCDLLQSEKDRRDVRLKAHFENDIWENRKQPPEDWNKPLPEWISKRDENSYLAVKSKKLKGEKSDVIDPDDYKIFNYCSIM